MIIQLSENEESSTTGEHEEPITQETVSHYLVSVLTRAVSNSTKSSTYILIFLDSNL